MGSAVQPLSGWYNNGRRFERDRRRSWLAGRVRVDLHLQHELREPRRPFLLQLAPKHHASTPPRQEQPLSSHDIRSRDALSLPERTHAPPAIATPWRHHYARTFTRFNALSTPLCRASSCSRAARLDPTCPTPPAVAGRRHEPRSSRRARAS
jgi:hypothetical protein